MVILYTMVSLIILWLMGYLVLKIMKINIGGSRTSFLCYILFGYCSLLSILMTLGTIFPLGILSVLLMIFIVVISAVYAKDVYRTCILETSLVDKISSILVLIPTTIISIPQLLKNELYISMFENNDFGYYIASIDWLKLHNLLETVEYTTSRPFYSLAEYMLEYTRIGMDITGAFLANIFNLESYQIFPVLIAISIAFIMIAVHEILYQLTGNQVIATVFGIFAAINGNNITLSIKQYAPQLIGISLLLFSFYQIDILFRDLSRKNIILCSLTVSGLLATYCEFAVYIAVFGTMYFMIFAIKQELQILPLIKMFFFTILFNILGFFKSVKFNMSIFSRVTRIGVADIDPYRGNMLGVKKILGCMLGVSDCYESRPYVFILSGIIIAVLLALGVMILTLKDSHRERMLILVWGCLFITLECYFFLSKGAYQEYKHVTSACALMFCVWGCIIGRFFEQIKFSRASQSIILSLFTVFIIYSICAPLNIYSNCNRTLDSDTLELTEAIIQQVPQNMEVEIDSSIGIADYMGASYALKDHIVNLNTDSYSYLQYFQQFKDNDPSEYVLYPRNHEFSFDESEVLVWCNKKYALAKRTKVIGYNYFDITSGGFASRNGVKISECGGYRVNSDAHEGYVLYGPYIHVNGTYDIVLQYTVLETAENTGIFDIFSYGNTLYSQQLNNSIGTHEISVQNQQFDNIDGVEFRVYASEGSIVRVDSIKYRRIENE